MMIGQRTAELAAQVQQMGQEEFSRVWGFAGGVDILDRQGFWWRPSWAALHDDMRPPEHEAPDPAQWPHGWQCVGLLPPSWDVLFWGSKSLFSGIQRPKCFFFFWTPKFFWIQNAFFLDTKFLFLTFSEVKGVSSIAKLLLTFWKVRSGKGVFFNRRRPKSSRKSSSGSKSCSKSRTNNKKNSTKKQKQHKTEKNKTAETTVQAAETKKTAKNRKKHKQQKPHEQQQVVQTAAKTTKTTGKAAQPFWKVKSGQRLVFQRSAT